MRAMAHQSSIGKVIDDAMAEIEHENPKLKDVLPKDYARPGVDKDRLGRVYEYFLARFVSAEGKKGGEFYTPRCVVRTLVEMLAPYKGSVYDIILQSLIQFNHSNDSLSLAG